MDPIKVGGEVAVRLDWLKGGGFTPEKEGDGKAGDWKEGELKLLEARAGE